MTETKLIPFHHHSSPLWNEFVISSNCHTTETTGKSKALKISLFFKIKGPLSRLEIPQLKSGQTQGHFLEGLWQNTCFEFFLKPKLNSSNGALNSRSPYLEFNFSPSGHFWFMLFEDYRKRDLSFEEKIEEMEQEKGKIHHILLPRIEIQNNQKDSLTLQAEFSLENFIPYFEHYGSFEGIKQINLCAITFLKNAIQGEEMNYWALKHDSQEKPDFHLF